MKTYVCLDLYEPPSGYPVCKNWVEQHNFLVELSELSYSDVSVILSMTAMLFASAWVWRLLSNHAFK